MKAKSVFLISVLSLFFLSSASLRAADANLLFSDNNSDDSKCAEYSNLIGSWRISFDQEESPFDDHIYEIKSIKFNNDTSFCEADIFLHTANDIDNELIDNYQDNDDNQNILKVDGIVEDELMIGVPSLGSNELMSYTIVVFHEKQSDNLKMILHLVFINPLRYILDFPGDTLNKKVNYFEENFYYTGTFSKVDIEMNK